MVIFFEKIKSSQAKTVNVTSASTPESPYVSIYYKVLKYILKYIG